jgi:dATP pyrophosphohydrolase
VSEARRYKRPESVLVVVHTQDLHCLLLERVEPAGFWQSVTGSLEWGETAAAAAARELREETGLAPCGLIDAERQRRFPILPAWRARYAPDVLENLEHWWFLKLPQTVPVRLHAAEHSRFEWLELDAAIARATSSSNRDALATLRTRHA